jgi:hypothetical protein
MTTAERATTDEKVVRSAYLRELKKFYQQKAGSKPVSEEYVAGKTRKLSQEDNTGITFWRKLGDYCATNGFDLNRLIRAFFMQVGSSTANFLLVNHEGIFSKSVAQTYQSLRPSADACKDQLATQKKQLALHIDKQLLINGTDREQSAKLALATITAPYCALFRYCMLTRLGDDPEPWIFSAIRQYMPDRESYDTAWGELIPETLKVICSKRNGAQS